MILLNRREISSSGHELAGGIAIYPGVVAFPIVL